MIEDLLTEEIPVTNKHIQQRKFTMMLTTLSLVQPIPQETKHRDIISRSTSNNRSQAQERNLPDVLLKQQSQNNYS